MQRYYVLPSDFRLVLDPGTIVHRDTLLGGTPFLRVRLNPGQQATVEAWRDGAPVGKDGALARALVHANLAQPVPPAGTFTANDVTLVVPARDRDVSRFPPGTIIVDDGSRTPIPGAAVRHATPRGAGAARNAGARLATTPLVAFLDSDTTPRPGWLEALLPHFGDPRVALVAPRIVSPPPTTPLARYEAEHSPLDRGPLPARVVPYGRVPFVPGAALVARAGVEFDETLTGGEDVDLVWRLTAQGRDVRYEPRAHVEHAHRTSTRAFLARRAYYGRTAAPLAKRHPKHARPLNISPWTAAAYLASARRPAAGAAILALATALLARRLRDPRLAVELAAGGTLASAPTIANALRRHYWPVAIRHPWLLAGSPYKALDDLAYGIGLWHGCIRHRTLDPLLPDLSWRIVEVEASTLIELARNA